MPIFYDIAYKSMCMYNIYTAKYKHFFQASCPRSGMRTLAYHISEVCNIPVSNLLSFNEREYIPNLYVYGHIINKPWDRIRLGNNAKYVHIIRDPRDVLLSTILLAPAVPIEMIDGWPVFDNIDDYKWFGNTWNQYMNHPYLKKAFAVYYEMLCSSPLETVTSLADYIGCNMVNNNISVLPYSEQCLKWQREPRLNKQGMELLWDECHEYMEPLGYTKDGHDLELLKYRQFNQ